MKGFVIAAVLGLLVSSSIAYLRALPTDYETQTAAQKQNYLWTLIGGSRGQPGSWPSAFELLSLFTMDLHPSMHHVSDIMPEGRKKLIHSVGATAKVKFVWNENAAQYTGLFKSANYGILRASTAAAPGYSGVFTKTKTYTPGIGVKFLRNGKPSANFVAMWSLSGQQDFNFFANPLANHVAEDPNLPTPLQLLAKRFHTVSDWVGTVGLSDFASITEDGETVANPNFPFGLVFQPNPEVSKKFEGTEVYEMNPLFTNTLSGNENLYKIYAVPEPESKNLIHIGFVQLTSKFAGSQFADGTLFFKHQRMEEDFALRPQWEKVFGEPSAKRWETEGAPKYAPLLPKY